MNPWDLLDHIIAISPDTKAALQRALAKYQLVYSLAGLVLGLVCIIGGCILFFGGISGSTTWTAKIMGAESTISDAAPGAVLFVVGLFLVVVTRFQFTHKKRG